jgi:hypothetical protein
MGMVDLRVDRRRLQFLVTEHLTDFGQGSPRPKHRRGGGVAKAMGANRSQPSPFTHPTDDCCDARGRDTHDGGVDGEEDLPRLELPGPPAQPLVESLTLRPTGAAVVRNGPWREP